MRQAASGSCTLCAVVHHHANICLLGHVLASLVIGHSCCSVCNMHTFDQPLQHTGCCRLLLRVKADGQGPCACEVRVCQRRDRSVCTVCHRAGSRCAGPGSTVHCDQRVSVGSFGLQFVHFASTCDYDKSYDLSWRGATCCANACGCPLPVQRWTVSLCALAIFSIIKYHCCSPAAALLLRRLAHANLGFGLASAAGLLALADKASLATAFLSFSCGLSGELLVRCLLRCNLPQALVISMCVPCCVAQLQKVATRHEGLLQNNCKLTLCCSRAAVAGPAGTEAFRQPGWHQV